MMNEYGQFEDDSHPVLFELRIPNDQPIIRATEDISIYDADDEVYFMADGIMVTLSAFDQIDDGSSPYR